MFSLTSLRKLGSALIRPPVLANQRYSNSFRPVFYQSQVDSAGSSLPSLFKPSFGGSGEKQSGTEEVLQLLLRSICSGVLIVGSSLGFCYLSHSGVSFSDPPNGANTWPTSSDDDVAQFEHSNPQKKSKFLFGGKY